MTYEDYLKACKVYDIEPMSFKEFLEKIEELKGYDD